MHGALQMLLLLLLYLVVCFQQMLQTLQNQALDCAIITTVCRRCWRQH